jgi:hypothetical protein
MVRRRQLGPAKLQGRQAVHDGEDDSVQFFYEVVLQKRSTGGIKPLLTISSDDLKDPDAARKLQERLAAALREQAAKA